jgi:predicted CopG family antitoxin
MQRNHKVIVVRNETYETLRHLGTVTEPFNDVISRLIQKAASGQQPFQGTAGQTAACSPLQPGESGGQNG